jgi:hypothetical protein
MHLTGTRVTSDALLKIGLTKGINHLRPRGRQAGMHDTNVPSYLHDNIIIPNEPTPKPRKP